MFLTFNNRTIRLHSSVCKLGLWIAFALVVVGCGSTGPEPTPTPTKTPTPQQAESAAAQPTATQAAPTATHTPAPAEPSPTPTPLPDNVAPYTGEVVADPAKLQRKPIFICVNNEPFGRAVHNGLSLADVVYEYIVDGFTLTRLTAMYHSRDAEHVGPVRSARLPNIWMTYMYDGALACSGGSDEIRYLLKNEVGFPYLDADIDDPSNNRYFFTIGTDYRTRMQVSTDGVRRWLAENGLVREWNRPGFAFDETPPPDAAGSATTINITYPGGNDVEWRYDQEQGGYVRYQGGAQQVDPATGETILASNVIVVAAEHELTDIVEDSLGTKSVDVKLYGFGDLRFFRDGMVYAGTWRANPENPPRWLGPGDAPIPLKPGQSWVQIVRDLDEVTYQ